MSQQTLGFGESGHGLADASEAVAIDPLDLDEFAVRLDRESAGSASEAAGRQDVVGAGRVVASQFGRPRPDEQGAGVAKTGDGRLERLDVDRQVLRGIGIDEIDRGVERLRERDAPMRAQGHVEDVGARGRRELVVDGRLDGVGEGRVGGDQDRRGVGAMLGLGDEVGGDTLGVRGGRGEDHALGGPGGEVDRDLAADLDLGGGDPGIARADDPIDGCEALVRQPVGKRADRLRTTGDDEGVDLEQPGGPEQDRMNLARRVGRGGHDDALDPGDLSGYHGHDQRRGVGCGAARHVGSDSGERGPSPLDLEAGDDGRAGRDRSLGFGKASDVLDRLVEGATDPRVEQVAGIAQVGRIEQEPAIASAAADGARWPRGPPGPRASGRPRASCAQRRARPDQGRRRVG